MAQAQGADHEDGDAPCVGYCWRSSSSCGPWSRSSRSWRTSNRCGASIRTRGSALRPQPAAPSAAGGTGSAPKSKVRSAARAEPSWHRHQPDRTQQRRRQWHSQRRSWPTRLPPSGKRLTTFEASYPRCIHSEIMTHRRAGRGRVPHCRVGHRAHIGSARRGLLYVHGADSFHLTHRGLGALGRWPLA